MVIVFRIEPGGEQARVTRPEKLAQASVVLRDELQGVPEGGTVFLTAHEPATNAATIKYVLEYLEHGFADAHGIGYDAKSLAEVCNVLVEYECDPEQFQGLWDRMTQKSSFNQGGQRRCWRTKIPPKETSTAAQLAISALVLGKQEELGKELGVIVWALDTKLDTTVPELQRLQAMRLEEQKQIFDELKHQLLRLYADRNDQRTNRLADKILQDVRDRNLGELTDTWEQNCSAHPELKEFNPYKLIRRFEDAIKPREPIPSSTPTRPMPAPEQGQPGGSRSFPIDLGELRHVVGQGLHSLVKRKSIADNSLATIDGIFDAVEAMVRARQMDRAISLIEQRKAAIAEWKRELDNPGSTRRPSPKGKGHQRGNSDQSVSQSRHLPRTTNGYRPSDNGEGSSGPRRSEGGRPNERPRPSNLNSGQWADNQDGGSKGKGKAQPAELSSVSTRRQRADNTSASSLPQARQTMLSAPQRAGSSNIATDQSGVDGVNIVNGLGRLQVDFDHGEGSWRHGDDSWLGGPRRRS